MHLKFENLLGTIWVLLTQNSTHFYEKMRKAKNEK